MQKPRGDGTSRGSGTTGDRCCYELGVPSCYQLDLTLVHNVRERANSGLPACRTTRKEVVIKVHAVMTALPPAVVLWGMIMRVMNSIEITVKVKRRD